MDSKYEITALLRKGRSGGVYRACDLVLDREVALRRFFAANGDQHPETWNLKFLETTQFLSSLQHPSLLPILDTGVDLDGAFTVNPLLKGAFLPEHTKNKPLDEAAARNMATQLLGALSIVHLAGGVHSALSPASIFVSPLSGGDLHFTIMDLGLAALTPNALGCSLSRDPVFLPIERLEQTPITSQSDCYQLGHIIYTTLLGGHPWGGQNREQCSHLHLNEVLPPLSDFQCAVSEEFQAWLYRLASNNADLRFKDAQQAIQALVNHTSTPPRDTAALSLSPNQPQDKLTSQQAITKGLIATLALLFLITSATALLVFRDDSEPDPAPINTAQEEAIPPLQSDLSTPATATLLPCSESLLYTTNTPTQHPRAACQILDHTCLDWCVFTAPDQAKNDHRRPNASIIGAPQAKGDIHTHSQPVGNLVFFNESGQLYLPSLYAQCLASDSGWKIPLNIPKNLSNDLKVTVHFSTWDCGSTITFQSTSPHLESATFSTEHTALFSSQAATYTIPLETALKLSQLDVILTSSGQAAVKEHGVSLNALIIQ